MLSLNDRRLMKVMAPFGNNIHTHMISLGVCVCVCSELEMFKRSYFNIFSVSYVLIFASSASILRLFKFFFFIFMNLLTHKFMKICVELM